MQLSREQHVRKVVLETLQAENGCNVLSEELYARMRSAMAAQRWSQQDVDNALVYLESEGFIKVQSDGPFATFAAG